MGRTVDVPLTRYPDEEEHRLLQEEVARHAEGLDGDVVLLHQALDHGRPGPASLHACARRVAQRVVTQALMS